MTPREELTQLTNQIQAVITHVWDLQEQADDVLPPKVDALTEILWDATYRLRIQLENWKDNDVH